MIMILKIKCIVLLKVYKKVAIKVHAVHICLTFGFIDKGSCNYKNIFVQHFN